MASVLQAFLNCVPVKRLIEAEGANHLRNCKRNAPDCITCQFVKVAFALYNCAKLRHGCCATLSQKWRNRSLPVNKVQIRGILGRDCYEWLAVVLAGIELAGMTHLVTLRSRFVLRVGQPRG